jgi:methylthioribulose 1-phosphate dehydratase/enolase-phosphatase E1
MQFHYLDSTKECATNAILDQLKVVLHNDKKGKHPSPVPVSGELNDERVSTAAVSYHVARGRVSVDVRDSADCWVRLHLKDGDGVTIPANLFHRLADGGDAAVSVTKDASVALTARYAKKADSIALDTYHTVRELVCELCRQFFEAGWVTGTGGSISIRHGNRIYMTPSGVQKERILPDELYVVDIEGAVLAAPEQKPGCRPPKLSDCSPLFLHAFKQRNAGAVLHSHAICCNLVTSLFEGQSEFRISHQEMIKGINGYGYFDELAIPIIENTAWEHELADSLGEAIANNPKACAVLVRRHGMYVWGDTWEQAKRHGECLHYLFEVALQMRHLGMDFNSPPRTITSAVEVVGQKRNGHHSHGENGNGMKRRALASPSFKVVLFDIEGTL